MSGLRFDFEQAALRVQARALQQAWLEAHADYWERRAQAWEWCKSRPGDFPGQRTAEEIAAHDALLQARADACRMRATGLDGVALVRFTETLHVLGAA